MNIIERGKQFLQSLHELGNRTIWDWKRCPHCGSMDTIKYGSYVRRPWFLDGRKEVQVQRHECKGCHKTYSEQSVWLKGGSWYAREVHRSAVDHWLHLGTSLRRTAEVLRSWMGEQERYLFWKPLATTPPESECCHLSASTVHRWLDQAGIKAQESVEGQLAGIADTNSAGIDGLWAKLQGGGKRVVLMLTDSVTGLVFPPVIAKGEESAQGFRQLFARTEQAGLDLEHLRGVTSDGAQGLASYMKRTLYWVQHQRCVWHLWRNLKKPMAEAAKQASKELGKESAKLKRKEVRKELGKLIHNIIDAANYDQAERALDTLRRHPFGTEIAQFLNVHLDHIMVYSLDYYKGLHRVTPEWCWRDFRLRLSHGRNHGSEQRLERATLLWAVYRNFTPAQERHELKRHYRHPGLSPLAVAGFPHEYFSYLDAMEV
jgi:hypothetical protein